MGSVVSALDVPKRLAEAAAQENELAALLSSSGDSFPGSGYRPENRKKWMEGLGASNLHIQQVVWPGTHDSATNGIGDPIFTRPFAECQKLSIYDQLAMGCRVLDVRVQKDRCVCHGILVGYSVDVVLDDVKRFLEETTSEVVVLEVRTEYGQEDPPGFAQYLIDKLGDYLIRQDEQVFSKSIAELLPKRVICVWKPRKSPAPKPGDLLRYFYRVENTATPVGDNLASLAVGPVTRKIHRFARLFISRVVADGHGNKLQVFSTDFIDEDFVDACVGFTKARIDGAPGT
ncbi:hypothetical protein HU200_029249 [Digitaria exilis]|uniref:Phosphatidylinositol-specific phospholipase C X domain-containing protein n=1 Tax=Digitaria exilis TaxID=1010633 RepID=A0A835BT95_9POAL|nr:hypothetical protein HU200_029249 [Digitaria exilis]